MSSAESDLAEKIAACRRRLLVDVLDAAGRELFDEPVDLCGLSPEQRELERDRLWRDIVQGTAERLSHAVPAVILYERQQDESVTAATLAPPRSPLRRV